MCASSWSIVPNTLSKLSKLWPLPFGFLNRIAMRSAVLQSPTGMHQPATCPAVFSGATLQQHSSTSDSTDHPRALSSASAFRLTLSSNASADDASGRALAWCTACTLNDSEDISSLLSALARRGQSHCPNGFYHSELVWIVWALPHCIPKIYTSIITESIRIMPHKTALYQMQQNQRKLCRKEMLLRKWTT